jgi:sugar transferase (PEP-CTERM system associated)
MSTPFATGVEGATMTGGAFSPTNTRSPAEPFSVRSLVDRIGKAIGRALVRMPPSTWLLADVAILSVAVSTAFTIFPPYMGMTTPHIELWQAAAVFAFSVIVSSLVFGLYERETIVSRSRILTRMLATTATAATIAYAIIYVVMYATVSRRAAGFTLAAFFLTGTMVRLCGWWAVHGVQRGLLVVGSRNLFDSFVCAQKEGFLREYALVGYATTRDGEGVLDGDDKYLGPVSESLRRVRTDGVEDIVIGREIASDRQMMDWIAPCLRAGCRVTNEAIFYEKATGQILVDEITPSWFLFADLKVHCEETATLKRVVDLTTAAVGLVLSVPLWPFIALAVKLCDGGPVFYSQDRVGQNGRIFKLYKVRTMRIDAENGKSVWASANDPRVTGIGRFLRKSRLDELPQLYNVLMGQMSIVGPRPERPDFVEQLREAIPYYDQRHLVKPGVTGWAQISYRYGASVEDARRKLQFDLYYLKHMAFELDVMILFRTVGTFLKGAC